MFIRSEKCCTIWAYFLRRGWGGGVEEGLDDGFEKPDEVDRPIQVRPHNGTFIFFQTIELGENILVIQSVNC